MEWVETARRIISGSINGLRNPEVDNFDDRLAVLAGYQYVTGLQIPMNDSFLMSMLNGQADINEKSEPIRQRKILSTAVFSNWLAAHKFHDKIGIPPGGPARIQYMCYTWMIHQFQRLSFSLERI
jgi:hypothetical protein